MRFHDCEAGTPQDRWNMVSLPRRCGISCAQFDRGRTFQESFKIGRSHQFDRINKFHALNNMPGWRNWQTHGT